MALKVRNNNNFNLLVGKQHYRFPLMLQCKIEWDLSSAEVFPCNLFAVPAIEMNIFVISLFFSNKIILIFFLLVVFVDSPLMSLFWFPYPSLSYPTEILFAHESFGLVNHIGHLLDVQILSSFPVCEIRVCCQFISCPFYMRT